MKETAPPGKRFRCHFVLFLIECVLYEKPKAASVDEGMQCTAERWGLLQGPAEKHMLSGDGGGHMQGTNRSAETPRTKSLTSRPEQKREKIGMPTIGNNEDQTMEGKVPNRHCA